MAHQKGNGEKSEGNGTVAVAIDKDKGSQYALKWAVDHLLGKGKCATLLHVKPIRSASSLPPIAMGNQGNLSPEDIAKAVKSQIDVQTKELFLPFRCFCTRKNIQVNEVVLEDPDIVKTICEYVKMNLIENLVVGAASRNGFSRRFKNTDIPGSISKGAPDFCNVYVISKGKILTLRPASIPIPVPSLSAHNSFSSMSNKNHADNYPIHNDMKRGGVSEAASFTPRTTITNGEVKSPFTRNRAANRSYGEFSIPDTDISFVSTSRASTNRMLPMFPENHDMGNSSSFFSNSSELDNRPSFGSPFAGSSDLHSNIASLTPHLQEHSSLSQASDEVEAEMRRLKQELKQTMDMYSTACKEALSAKQKAMELHRWKMEEQQRLEEAQLAEEAALAIAEKEKMKCKAAIEAAKAAQRIAELEAQKRINAEKKALKETEEMKKVLDTLAQNDLRYRRYSIEEIETATEFFSESRKIGEGGYGPVYKCYLDHTPVAVKVLRPDAAQGRSQFQQEVEVLSCIRHPNMVLLLGACPEYGCLVYEYMANGSLDDCLFRRRNSPVLSWQLRFRIAAEIGTGLLFLHQTKPEPLVHRDLKPANILLDRNYVSKISDVGLARLVPPSVADTVTQYRMTSTAGTFCYIDPEYQQTGMLGIKSDIYSLGVMLLQIITAKSPMGLTHHVERAIENGTFAEMLDPAVVDWPVEEALCFAELALKCAELRRKDRPDLRSVILPELNRLRGLAEETMPNIQMSSSPRSSSHHSNVFSSSSSSTTPSGFTSPLQLRNSRYESLWSRSGTSSYLHDKD